MKPENRRPHAEDVRDETAFPRGSQELPEGGAPTTDPYTPEPGPRAGEGRAFGTLAWAWIVVLIVVAVVVWAILG